MKWTNRDADNNLHLDSGVTRHMREVFKNLRNDFLVYIHIWALVEDAPRGHLGSVPRSL